MVAELVWRLVLVAALVSARRRNAGALVRRVMHPAHAGASVRLQAHGARCTSLTPDAHPSSRPVAHAWPHPVPPCMGRPPLTHPDPWAHTGLGGLPGGRAHPRLPAVHHIHRGVHAAGPDRPGAADVRAGELRACVRALCMLWFDLGHLSGLVCAGLPSVGGPQLPQPAAGACWPPAKAARVTLPRTYHLKASTTPESWFISLPLHRCSPRQPHGALCARIHCEHSTRSS